MRAIAVCVVCLSLQGCWFVFIPGSVVSSVSDSLGGYEGQNCVPREAKVGDKIRLLSNGGMGTVMKLEGESSRCKDTNMPIRALIRADV